MSILTRTTSHEFELANIILGPTITLLRNQTFQPDFDMWKLMNWIFVTYYWTFLGDLGQISPTTYVPWNQWANANFSQATFHTASNNIFVNESLFEVYTKYMNETLLPLLLYGGIGEINPLSTENQLTWEPTTFIRGYDCTERQLKSAVSFIFGVFATLWAVMHVFYTFVKWITGKFARWDTERGNSLLQVTANS